MKNTSLLIKIMERLRLKLADSKDAAETVAYAVANNFDKLPYDVSNELLRRARKNKNIITQSIGFIG